jgi:hypothetical protein
VTSNLPQAGAAPSRPGRTVLVLPQNRQNVETVNALAPALRAHGLVERALLLDGLFQQGIGASDLSPDIETHELELRSAAPFYRLDPIRQIRVISRVRRPLQRAIGRPGLVLAFNDGAIQRLAFRSLPTTPTVLLIDGMLSDYAAPAGIGNRLRQLLKVVGGAARSTPLGIVLPSEVGLSAVDCVCVIGEHSGDMLRRRGARAKRIIATGLPRWPEDQARPDPAAAQRLLYLSGAFAWHQRRVSAEAQVEDVQVLADVCRELDLELTVRVHPRDDWRPWEDLGVKLVTGADRSIAEDVAAADVVCSMVSTGLLEAISLGAVALPIVIHDDFRTYASSFVSDPGLAVARSRSELRSRLAAWKIAIPAADLARQRQTLATYFAAGGDEAARRVAAELDRLIQ